MAITVKHPFVSTVPDGTDTSLVRPSNWNADHTVTGLGTAAELNAGVANGVATLDSSGKVPVSQIPQMGDLNYQGTWNASTNTPTLASGTGTKGYYYVVSVAGTTNLDGITDWQIGDWAVFNGTAWQKVDNTDLVTSVNGYTGAVSLTYSDVGAANAPTNTNITSMTGITGGISSPDYVQFDVTYSTALTAGQLGWDGNNTLGLGMAGGNVTQHIGEDQFFYTKATSAITKGQVVMFTGAVGASGVPTGAPATGIANGTYIMGVAAENIALNGFGLVQSFGTLRNVNTAGFADGEILWYNPAVTGGLTATKPSAPNVKVQIAAVINGNSSGGGTILIRIDPGSQLGGTDSNVQMGTLVDGNLLQYYGAGAYWRNVAASAVTGVGSVANAVTFNNSGTGDASGATYNGSAVKTISYNTIGAQPAGTYVTSVGATAPITSSGGTTPTIAIPVASASANGYLSSTDWSTFNSKQPAGTYVTAVSIASSNGFAGTSSGGATPALTLSTTISGILKGNATAISAATAGTDYVAPSTTTNFTAQQYFGNVALSDAATISWAANTAQVATFTFVSSNRTMGAPSGLVNGAFYSLAVIQNGGSNTLTWNSVFKWTGGTAPTLSTAAGAKDYFVFRSDGTNLYEQGRSLGVA